MLLPPLSFHGISKFQRRVKLCNPIKLKEMTRPIISNTSQLDNYSSWRAYLRNLELLQRNGANESGILEFRYSASEHCFLAFCSLIKGPEFEVRPFHEILGSALEDLVNCRYKNLAISLPPRSGKTTLTVLFLAWLIGRDPSAFHVYSSYGGPISRKTPKEVDSVLKSDLFSKVFPRYTLKVPHLLVAPSGGSFCGFAAGNQSSSSEGVGAFVIDDPIQYYDSGAENLEAWWKEQASIRAMGKYCRLLVGSRCFGMDLFDIVAQGSEEWRFINIEALCENPDTDVLGRSWGESFWPDRLFYTESSLNAQREAMGVISFQTLFQGKPFPRKPIGPAKVV